MATELNFTFSRNDAGSIQVEFKNGNDAYDLEANGVIFSLGTFTVPMQIDDAANGLASLQITAATLATFAPGLYDSRITIAGSVPTLVPTYINSDQTNPDGATYNNSIIIDIDTSDICIANAGGGGGVPGVPGTDGKGWTAGDYDASTGVVTFSSDDGLGFSTGDLRGEQGEQGEQGEKGDDGDQGDQGDQGIQGDQGVPGTDGTSVTLEGSVQSVGNLPNGKDEGVLYIVLDTGDGYVSNGDNTWTNVGPIQGPPGEKGDDGDQGEQGDQGLPGQQGNPGLQGDAATIAVGSTTTLTPGSSATVANSGTDEDAVFDFGIPQGAAGQQGLKGDDGDPGADGPSVTIAAGTGAPPSGWLTTASTGDFFVRGG